MSAKDINHTKFYKARYDIGFSNRSKVWNINLKTYILLLWGTNGRCGMVILHVSMVTVGFWTNPLHLNPFIKIFDGVGLTEGLFISYIFITYCLTIIGKIWYYVVRIMFIFSKNCPLWNKVLKRIRFTIFHRSDKFFWIKCQISHLRAPILCLLL